MTPIQIKRWCVIDAAANRPYHVCLGELDAREDYGELIQQGWKNPHEIYVAEVTMMWLPTERVTPKWEGE